MTDEENVIEQHVIEQHVVARFRYPDGRVIILKEWDEPVGGYDVLDMVHRIMIPKIFIRDGHVVEFLLDGMMRAYAVNNSHAAGCVENCDGCGAFGGYAVYWYDRDKCEYDFVGCYPRRGDVYEG